MGTGDRKNGYRYYRQLAIVPFSHVWWKEGVEEDDPAEGFDFLGVLQRDRCARNDASRAFVDRSVAFLACLTLDGEGALAQQNVYTSNAE